MALPSAPSAPRPLTLKRVTTNALGKRVVSPLAAAGLTVITPKNARKGYGVAYRDGKPVGFVKGFSPFEKGIGLHYGPDGRPQFMRVGATPGVGDLPYGRQGTSVSQPAPVPAGRPPAAPAAPPAPKPDAQPWQGDPALLDTTALLTKAYQDAQANAAYSEREDAAERARQALDLGNTAAQGKVNLMREAVRMGLGRSGFRDEGDAQTNRNFIEALAGVDRQMRDRAEGRRQSLATAQQELERGILDAQQAAVQRQITLDQERGVPLPPEQAAPALAAAVAAATPRRIPHTDSRGRKGHVNVYPDGRRVFVPAKAR